MIYPIEYENAPAVFIPRVAEIFCAGLPIAKGKVVLVCAWCDIEKKAAKISAAGYQVSHGICESCKQKL